MSFPPPNQPLIKTFVQRQRMRPKRRERLARLLAKYAIDLNKEIDLQKLFGRSAPLYLEIGFGSGEVLFNLAQNYPQYNFIGIEVYLPGVETLLSKVAGTQLKNVKVFTQDARLVLEKAIADNSLSGILIFFPDPWPKTRHHKRRIIQPEFVELAIKKLAPNGYIHFATDIKDYAKHALKVFSANSKLSQQHGTENILPRSTSKFATRGIKAGRENVDLIFIKCKRCRK